MMMIKLKKVNFFSKYLSSLGDAIKKDYQKSKTLTLEENVNLQR